MLSVVFSPHGGRTCRTVLKTSHFTTDSTYRTDNTGAHESSTAETRSENPRRRSGYPDPWSGSCPKMHLSDGRAIPGFAQHRKIRRQSPWIRIGVDLTCVSRRWNDAEASLFKLSQWTISTSSFEDNRPSKINRYDHLNAKESSDQF
jgi:hypothetical protein